MPRPSVVIKPNKDVPSDSLQNPSDPDAGYCGHKGKGYQMQVMETYSPDKSQPNLITHVKVEAAHESDSNALLPAIEDAAKRELAPKQLLADSLYGSDDNVEKAKELGVEVVSPTMGTQSHTIGLADFAFSDSDEIIACPEGQKPQRIKTGKNGGKIVHFDKAICDNCPRQSDCPVKRDKRAQPSAMTPRRSDWPDDAPRRRRKPSARSIASAPGLREPCQTLIE